MAKLTLVVVALHFVASTAAEVNTLENKASPANLVKPGKTALLIVDMQNDFCHKDGSLATKFGIPVDLGTAAIVPAINRLLADARSRKVPVVWITANYKQAKVNPAFDAVLRSWPDRPCASQWGMAIIDQFQVANGEIKIEKSSYNGFNTNLPAILRAKGVETVVVTGGLTSVCVESTVRGALLEGFYSVVAKDAVTDSPVAGAAALGRFRTFFGQVFSADEICKQWA